MARKGSRQWLLIAAATGAAIIVVAVLLIDPIIELAIEHYGTKAVGAKVDIADVDTDFFPLGITITGIDVTDPRQPMRNAVSAKMARGRVEVGPLLKKKLIVDTLDLIQVRFDTPRQSSGALPGAPPPAPATKPKGCDPLTLPSLAAPDMNALLDGDSLKSVAEIKALEADLAKARSDWDQRLKSLPDQEKFDGYRKRIEALQKSSGLAGLLSAATEVQSVQKEVEADIKQIETAQSDFTTEVNGLNQRITAAKALPQQDFARLSAKYAPTSENMGKLGRSLLGQAFCGWLQTAEEWYRRLAAMTGQGADGDEDTPSSGSATAPPAPPTPGLPDLLIRRAKASIVLAAGTVSGTFRNITHQPQVLGKPTQALITAEKLKGLDQLKLAATLDHTRATTWRDEMTGSISGLIIDRTPLTNAGGANVAIETALLNSRFNGTIENGQIESVVNSSLNQLEFAMEGAPENDPLAAAMADTLAGVDTASINARISGTITGYALDLNTDLDKILARALSGTVRRYAGKFQAQLRAGIAEQTRGPLSNITKNMNGMGGIDKTLGNRLKLGQGVLGGI